MVSERRRSPPRGGATEATNRGRWSARAGGSMACRVPRRIRGTVAAAKNGATACRIVSIAASTSNVPGYKTPPQLPVESSASHGTAASLLRARSMAAAAT